MRNSVAFDPPSLRETPPAPRKLPKQRRSRMLVESIKQACRQILEHEGAGHLSAMHLSQISGVAVGSIYQYYPNLQAIVADVYAEEALREIQHGPISHREQFSELSLRDAITLQVEVVLRFYRRMLKLDRAFFQQFCLSFDLHDLFNEFKRDPEASTCNLMRMVDQTIHGRKIDNLQMKSFMAMQAMRATVLACVQQYPEYLEKAAFSEALVDQCLGIFLPDERWRQEG